MEVHSWGIRSEWRFIAGKIYEPNCGFSPRVIFLRRLVISGAFSCSLSPGFWDNILAFTAGFPHGHTLWWFNIAIENDSKWWFSIAMLVYQRVPNIRFVWTIRAAQNPMLNRTSFTNIVTPWGTWMFRHPCHSTVGELPWGRWLNSSRSHQQKV